MQLGLIETWEANSLETLLTDELNLAPLLPAARAHGRHQKREDLLSFSNSLNTHAVRTASLLSFWELVRGFPTRTEKDIAFTVWGGA